MEPLSGRLRVTATETADVFCGHPPRGFDQRVFGGHMMAQALLAAGETVDPGRVASSTHTYFLMQGQPAHPLEYTVTRLRDGRSFSVRAVTVTQAQATVMTCQILFNRTRSAQAPLHTAAPDVPAPETLPPLHLRRELACPPDGIKLPTRARWWTASRPLDVRYIDGDTSARRFWFRTQPLTDAAEHMPAAILAFASDRSLLPAMAQARGGIPDGAPQKVASLDHAIWFHADTTPGGWLLFDQSAPYSSSGMGLIWGRIYSRTGDLVASVAQLGLVHP